MSGDRGSAVMLTATAEALRRHRGALHPILCGHRDCIASQLRELPADDREMLDSAEIEHCPETVENAVEPVKAWTEKKQSSVVRCIALQEEGKARASVSAGDTGVLMSAALFILGRSCQYKRPALAAFLPTARGIPSLLLDVGANVSCRAEHLVDFARMGFEYYQRHFRNNPATRVCLLNVGKEPYKGTPEIRQADSLLRAEMQEVYAGFVEGSEVLQGTADVLVCDGFTGNVVLKTCEAIHRLIENVLGPDSPALDSTRKLAPLNPENYGGAPLLGIQGTVCKAHGASSAVAMANAISLTVSEIETTDQYPGEKLGEGTRF